jgi:hypothetical protein
VDCHERNCQLSPIGEMIGVSTKTAATLSGKLSLSRPA